MVQNVKKIGKQRYRETFGRYYEDFVIGDVYEHRPGRTITETDNTWFTLLTMNTHPLHFDAEYAKASEFGKRLVASPLTVSLMVGMSVTDTSQKAIANLGWTDIQLTSPVFIGDTLYSESEVLDKRESKSRPTAGIAEGALKHAIRYSQERSAFGKPICQHQAIQMKLAEMVTRVEGAKHLINAAADKFDRKERCDLEAAMAKLAGSEAGVYCAQEAMRIFGGYSLSVEYEIERYYRDCMLMVIGEGTNEILRQIIAKQLIERNKI